MTLWRSTASTQNAILWVTSRPHILRANTGLYTEVQQYHALIIVSGILSQLLIKIVVDSQKAL